MAGMAVPRTDFALPNSITHPGSPCPSSPPHLLEFCDRTSCPSSSYHLRLLPSIPFLHSHFLNFNIGLIAPYQVNCKFISYQRYATVPQLHNRSFRLPKRASIYFLFVSDTCVTGVQFEVTFSPLILLLEKKQKPARLPNTFSTKIKRQNGRQLFSKQQQWQSPNYQQCWHGKIDWQERCCHRSRWVSPESQS